MSKDLCEVLIQPNKGAAGTKLGKTSKTINELWGEPIQVTEIRSDYVRWEYRCVSFWFKAGKLDQIGVNGSYEGRTEDGIGIGSTRAEVESIYGALEWDGTWLINVPPFGIGFDFERDVDGEPRVSGIYVFRE